MLQYIYYRLEEVTPLVHGVKSYSTVYIYYRLEEIALLISAVKFLQYICGWLFRVATLHSCYVKIVLIFKPILQT